MSRTGLGLGWGAGLGWLGLAWVGVGLGGVGWVGLDWVGWTRVADVQLREFLAKAAVSLYLFYSRD